MKNIYYQSFDSQWKYELEDGEYESIIGNMLKDKPDMDEMLNESLEILRDLSALDENEFDEDDEVDQTIATAFVWYYFNTVAKDDNRIIGDIVLVETEEGDGVTVMSAEGLIEEDE